MAHLCDLHTHTIFSDGTFTPAQLVAEAVSCGLEAVALCDHNTIAGLSDFLTASNEAGIIGVPAVEFTTEYKGVELHILGMFIPESAYSKVNSKLDEYNRRKDASNALLVENLRCKGYNLDYDAIKSSTPNGNVNRAVIARKLVSLGYVESVNHAFNTILDEKAGFYIPPERLGSLEMIRFIKLIGAVAVIAHPLFSFKKDKALNEELLREFLTEAKACGLDGMETLYSLYTDEETSLAKQLADEFSLLQSGGSDFHGATKPDISLGRGKGNLEIPIEFYHKLCNVI